MEGWRNPRAVSAGSVQIKKIFHSLTILPFGVQLAGSRLGEYAGFAVCIEQQGFAAMRRHERTSSEAGENAFVTAA